jgi:DNA-directed RNA polymerase specialized sigma24 family protein
MANTQSSVSRCQLLLRVIAMIAQGPFRELIRRVRAGDQSAATELVKQFEPEIRRFIRLRLTDPGLHRILDSADIWQSVLANFFVRVAGGQYDLDRPDQLVRLLITMARHRLVDHARKPSSRRNRDGDSALWAGVAANQETPSAVVANEELLREGQRRLTAEERLLAERRADGQSWQEIAAAHGGTPDSLRKKLRRALDRVCHELGLDKTSNG